jgi:hypothetical protein
MAAWREDSADGGQRRRTGGRRTRSEAGGYIQILGVHIKIFGSRSLITIQIRGLFANYRGILKIHGSRLIVVIQTRVLFQNISGAFPRSLGPDKSPRDGSPERRLTSGVRWVPLLPPAGRRARAGRWVPEPPWCGRCSVRQEAALLCSLLRPRRGAGAARRSSTAALRPLHCSPTHSL